MPIAQVGIDPKRESNHPGFAGRRCPDPDGGAGRRGPAVGRRVPVPFPDALEIGGVIVLHLDGFPSPMYRYWYKIDRRYSIDAVF